MPLRESIRFAVAPRDIRLAAKAVPSDVAEQLRAADRMGYERGVIDGERALSEQLLRQRTELLDLHIGAVTALRDAVPQVVQQSEEGLIALAFEIAQKLVAELPITREMVAASIREALDQVEDTTEFTVSLHSDDLKLLGTDYAELLGAESARHKIRFTASQDATRGGCLVQTRFGTIDTRRETKIARVAETLSLS
ncbi:MAG TPA: FliH/SctL family protein [Candidatus Acidoferrum sp.]|nr:FliH/SctL family protein [Candidatus Acidoferrum sp.]